MKIKVFSEREVLIYKPTEPYIHISITSPESGVLYVPANKFRRMFLSCKFHDLDREYPMAGIKLFDKKEAQRILYWVQKFVNNVQFIVVNCEAGISRSAGVAAALSKIYNGDDSYYFKNYLPNMLVYRTILEEYYNG